MLHQFYHRHFSGPGGIGKLLPIAIPIIASNASETAMMFIDRLYLAHLSKQHMAAAMIGGLSVFTALSFFVGVMNYTNALVAQHYGSGQPKRCPVAVIQSLILSLLAVPYMLAVAYAGPKLFALFGHAPQQLQLESTYFRLLMFSGVFVLGRFAFTGFFAGIGQTRIVMTSNITALVVNMVANYILIFGKLGFPAMGIEGAALGTIIARATALLMLAFAYFSPQHREEFATNHAYRFDRAMFGKLIGYGAPAGIELFLSTGAFNLAVQLLHSYGANVAAAVTITFNWDIVAFIPMIGFNVATMSLVGRYMGARDVEHAERAAYSGMKVAYCYAAVMMTLFLSIPGILASVFAPDAGTDYSEVLPLARNMIRLAAVYTLADATFLVFGGALRGAGDTRWIMYVTVMLHWIMVAVLFFAVKVMGVGPLQAWMLFIGFVLTFGSAAFLRFRTGKWKTIRVVESIPRPKTGPRQMRG